MATLDERAIQGMLPHRDPFLFVDAVLAYDLDGEAPWIETRWHVRPDMEVFRGHFPGQPVLPGVLIQEHCFQSGALLIYLQDELQGMAGGTPVLTKVEDARFRRMVAPDTTLTTRVELTDRLANARYLKASVRSEDGQVARLRCALALAEPNS